MKTKALPVLWPVAAWLLCLLLAGPEFRQSHWESALILFAALALVPLGLDLLHVRWPRFYWGTAAGLGLAYILNLHPAASYLALPYLLLAAWLTIHEALAVLVYQPLSLDKSLKIFALGYWATGALFAFCVLSGLSPLGFDAVMTGLTAAHFHLAGFVLTVLIYQLLQIDGDRLDRALAWAALFGMPMVATGIVLTKLGYPPLWEWVSALGFAVMALLVVLRQVQLGFDRRYTLAARCFWLAGGACLLAGATLALLYALRFHWPLAWINIPNMKSWHGTLNAVGFGWLTLLGWRRYLVTG